MAEDGTFWVSATGFPQGGFLDPEVWSTRVYVGSQDELPSYDPQRSTVSNGDAEVRVIEDTWSQIDIEAGGSWLWTNSGSIVLKSCEAIDIADVEPVHPD